MNISRALAREGGSSRELGRDREGPRSHDVPGKGGAPNLRFRGA